MSTPRLSIEDFLSRQTGSPVLDVRSPAEFKAGHLPGSISFPLFNDEERAVIGTIYKIEGRHNAIKKGFEIVAPRMATFIEEAETLAAKSFRLYCWRGGMRSESMAWLLDKCGFDTVVLEGGYKAYRNALLKFFEQPLPLIVVAGYTGSKKTQLLHLLADHGAQVVDLEGLARHQGSSFGNQKAGSNQPTSEHFQNLLYDQFRSLDLARPIFLEDESIRIGQVNLPDALFRQMNGSVRVLIEADKAQRMEFLVEDYGKLAPEQLIAATEAIRKKLGHEKAKEAIVLIKEGRLLEAADIILTYYDDRYESALSTRAHLIAEHVKVDLQRLEEVASMISTKANEIIDRKHRQRI